MEYLNSPVKRVDYVDAILAVDLEPGGQLKLSRSRAPLPEVIEQSPLLVEHLHHAPLRVYDIEMPFRIETNTFRTKYPSRPVSDFSNGIAERARAIENLHAEIHGVDHDEIGPIQSQLCRVIELAISRPWLSNHLQHAALHVHHVNLVAQRVGHVDALRGGIHR